LAGDGRSSSVEAFDGPVVAPSMALSATFDMEGILLPLLMSSFQKRLLLRLRYLPPRTPPPLPRPIFSKAPAHHDPPHPLLSFSNSEAAFLSNLKNVSTFQTPRTLNPQQSTGIPPPLPFVRWPSAIHHVLIDLSIRDSSLVLLLLPCVLLTTFQPKLSKDILREREREAGGLVQ